MCQQILSITVIVKYLHWEDSNLHTPFWDSETYQLTIYNWSGWYVRCCSFDLQFWLTCPLVMMNPPSTKGPDTCPPKKKSPGPHLSPEECKQGHSPSTSLGAHLDHHHPCPGSNMKASLGNCQAVVSVLWKFHGGPIHSCFSQIIMCSNCISNWQPCDISPRKSKGPLLQRTEPSWVYPELQRTGHLKLEKSLSSHANPLYPPR